MLCLDSLSPSNFCPIQDTPMSVSALERYPCSLVYMLLGPHEGHTRTMLEPCWAHTRTMLGPYWDHTRVIPGPH